jgi:hypothetical protein
MMLGVFATEISPQGFDSPGQNCTCTDRHRLILVRRFNSQNVMKNTIKFSALILIGFAIITGCEQQPAKSTSDRFQESLTTDELARLMHFHAIKLVVPQSQQPFQQIRIVLVKPDGTIVPKGGVAAGNNTNDPACKILVGYRIEGEIFSGSIAYQDSKGGCSGDFSFTDSYATRNLVFGGANFFGTKDEFEKNWYWKNGLFQLAADGPPGSTNTILAIQLVRDAIAGK